MNNSNFDDIYKLFSISSITQLYQKHIWKTSCTHVKLTPQQVEVSISYRTKVGSKICWCYSYQIRATEIKYTYYIQKKGKITLYEIRSTLEARCSLLRETRFQNVHECLGDIIKLL